MKKYLFLLLATIMVQSCTNDSTCVEKADVSDPTISTLVTPEMAIEEVKKFLIEVECTRAGFNRRVESVYATGSASVTRNNDVVNDTPLVYVVNFEDNQGFAIVSGDTRVHPILMMADSGSLPEGAVIDNPGMIAMLSLIETEYKMKLGMPVEDTDGNIISPIGVTADGNYIYPDMYYEGELLDPNISLTNDFSVWGEYVTYGEALECEWGQSVAPYNLYTYTSDGVHAPAGCVPTAVAQIMYFWGHNYTYNGRYFNWDLMRNHINSYTNSYSNAYTMIGELYYQLGLPANLDVTYDAVNGSGAACENIPRTFEHFGYTSGGSVVSYNFDEIFDVISTRPVYVSGYSFKTVVPIYNIFGIQVGSRDEYTSGHAWVIDQVLERSRYKLDGGIMTRALIKETEYLVHCNFGWSGSCNGYYYSGIFNTNDGPVVTRTETNSEGQSRYYKYYLRMNTGIYL